MTKNNTMKKIILFAGILLTIALSCHEKTEGYLITKNAAYVPDTMYVYKTPDPVTDALRIQNKAPWVSIAMQGYEGTEEIYFIIESVTSTLGTEAIKTFRDEISIRGGGILEYPLENNAQPGAYTISVRLTNPGYSQVVENAITVIIVE